MCWLNNIDIEVRSLKDGNTYLAPVSAYPDAVAGAELKIVAPDEKVVDLGEIRIIFDYPLTHSAEFSFIREGGFTRKALYEAIYDGYKRIYSAEPDPGTIPGMANRARSTGPFGIYGHYLEDLIIAGVYEVSPGVYELNINS